MKTFYIMTAAAYAALSFTLTAMGQSVTTIDRGELNIHVFVSKPVIFQVSSVILESENELALVDAQFSADNAQSVVDEIRSIGKPLTTIFISFSDPDYYLGLDLIANAFPDAKILASPQTVWTIEATKDDKMAVWAPQLGGINDPLRLLPVSMPATRRNGVAVLPASSTLPTPSTPPASSTVPPPRTARLE